MYNQDTNNRIISLNPAQFYKIVELMNSFDTGMIGLLKEPLKSLEVEYKTFSVQMRDIEAQNRELIKEIDSNSMINPFANKNDDKVKLSRTSLSRQDNFVKVIYDVLEEVLKAYEIVIRDVSGLRMEKIHLSSGGSPRLESFEDYQKFTMELSLNSGAISRFIDSVESVNSLSSRITNLGYAVSEYINQFNQKLRNRHKVEGIKVHINPILTDIAITVMKNTDSDGEVERGIDPDKINRLSIKKAILITDSLKSGAFSDWIKNPGQLIEFITSRLSLLWDTTRALEAIIADSSTKLNEILDNRVQNRKMSKSEFNRALELVRDNSPLNITYLEPSSLLTAEEKDLLERENSDIEKVARALSVDYMSSEDIINMILDLKRKKRDYQLEVNSFFVCRIDAGNPFSGEAPGALKVIPGIKPQVDLSNVIGSGFEEAREFINQIDKSNRFSNLFLATSPSGKMDKTNVLLVGPQGCGKTEILRGVASKKGIIGVFAQASDFLTCWKGEMEKNPKRLFEASLKLHKESKRNVFILIDEIDTILNSNTSQYSFGGTNLSTEFQVLMDGITTYSGLGIWGATNHPDRLPTPILRRFAKVLIVGELNQKDRVRLLKQFCGHMPIDTSFSEQAWEDAALLLEGAVGDIIRKVIDHLWREKMTWFVENHAEKADELVAELNKDGTKFSLSSFSRDERESFRAKLAPYVSIRPEDLVRSIQIHLGNLAIKKEIEVCVQTYESARQYVASL